MENVYNDEPRLDEGFLKQMSSAYANLWEKTDAKSTIAGENSLHTHDNKLTEQERLSNLEKSLNNSKSEPVLNASPTQATVLTELIKTNELLTQILAEQKIQTCILDRHRRIRLS